MAYDHVLAADEKKELLRIARTTLKEYLLSGRIPPGAPHNASLTAPASVFVSIHENDALRGCIGTTNDSTPLYKAVQEMVVAAASRDPRYRPVKLDELPRLALEVSVLGPRTTIGDPSEIEIGIHGVQVMASSGSHAQRGLFLPKVAVEQRWDPETFLSRACEKAGLPPEQWRSPDAQVERFTAQVFDERELKVGPFASKPAHTPLE
jgi:AmmeMemoRadiSam system protein A